MPLYHLVDLHQQWYHIMQYCSLLETALLKHNLSSNAAQIYNINKSGKSLDHCPPNVIARRRQKKVQIWVAGRKEQITVRGCVNGIRQSISPMVIFEGKIPWPGVVRPLVKGPFPVIRCARTTPIPIAGWPQLSLRTSKHRVGMREECYPVLLASSHTGCASTGLHSVWASEASLDKCLPWFPAVKPGMVITKFTFARIFSGAWLKALTPESIVVGI